MNTKIGKMTTVLALTGMAFVVLSAGAGEHVKSVKVLKIVDGDGTPVELRFKGDAGFNDLAEGETRTLTTADGEAVAVTRNGDQLSLLTSSGKTVELPVLDGAGMHKHGPQHQQRRIKIVHQAGDEASQIMIVSPGGLSDQDQTTIRQAIQSAGIDKEVLFIGGEMEANINVEIDVDE